MKEYILRVQGEIEKDTPSEIEYSTDEFRKVKIDIYTRDEYIDTFYMRAMSTDDRDLNLALLKISIRNSEGYLLYSYYVYENTGIQIVYCDNKFRCIKLDELSTEEVFSTALYLQSTNYLSLYDIERLKEVYKELKRMRKYYVVQITPYKDGTNPNGIIDEIVQYILELKNAKK